MLRALELTGFKSFADKTRLEFHAGVTCVVGPNGSGKSNVVDAIKWVTGSQSAKALRGKEMTDVIFNGASGRRPMNAAEVTLEFDNSAGLFDLQAPLARITRRVYRSGEGEYLINGAPSRLREIRTLLAGTGIGAEAYSIIEQGRVDAMLRASPRDRRGIFEEAAGVSRFRIKKQEAAKRLARVEQNLLRLSDIVDEVEGRLRRVKKQAGRAQRYRDSAERLKELRTLLGVTDWRTLSRRATRLQQEVDLLREEHGDGDQTLAQAEAELQRLEREGQQAAARAAEEDRRMADTRERVGAARATIAAQAARLAELQDELRHKRNRLAGELADGGSRHGHEHESSEEQLRAAAAQFEESRRLLDDLSNRRDAAEQAWSALKLERREATELAEEVGESRSTLARERERLELTLRDLQQRLDAATRSAERLAERTHRAASELDLARQDEASAQGELAALDAAHAEHQARTEELRASLAERQRLLSATEARAVGLRHELEAIERLEHDLAELRSGVGEPNAGGAQDDWSVLGIVADLLHVDYDSAPMVEAALGDRAHHLVIDSGRNLLANLAAGRRVLSRRAALERLDSQPSASVVDRVDLSREPGVMGRADQFVECDPAHQSLVRRLLGRVWFVDTLATAERLANGLGRGLSFVTYAGESISADGVLTVGPRDEARGVLTRKSRADDLRAALRDAEQTLGEAALGAAGLEEQIQTSQAAERDALRRRNAAAEASAEARHAARRVEEALASQTADLEHQRRQADSLRSQLTDHSEAVRRAQAESTELDGEAIRIGERLQAVAGNEKDAFERLKTLDQQLVQVRVDYARCEQRLEILQTQQRHARGSLDDQARSRAEAASEARDCRRRLAECELRLLAAESEFNRLCVEAEARSVARDHARGHAHAVNERRRLIDNAARQRREQLSQLQAQQQKLGLELREARLEQSALAEKMREDYGIDLAAIDAAIDAAADDPPAIEDRRAIEQEIAALREDVREVGPVNLESIDELDDLEARFNELSAQYTDLSEAKNSLERLTQRINGETRKMFLATIEAVRGEFRELFRQLFGGGEADIVLIDGEGADPLDAGVEIAAQPPGKELSSISLLSGGEKTMTCVALLLALFRTKPSPFCILDEVDAALDEANIGRFTGVLSEFLSSTQFIVITHSKKTMSHANTMYGITMQESGVSKQVAVRFDEVDEEGNIRPRSMLGGEQKQAA